MPSIKSVNAFNDARELLDRALATPKGIKIACGSRQAATVLRARCNYFRKIDREENKKTYEEGHHLNGASAYDVLALRIPPKGAEGDSVLYIEPRLASQLEVEEIT